jgi:hypothetical protein
MKNRKGLKDAESVAAMEMVVFEQRSEEMSKLSLKKRETAVAQVFRMAGRVEMAALMEAQGTAMKLLYMKQVKDGKAYREEFEMTWQQFCDMVGEDRRRIDEQLVDLKPFTAALLTKFVSATGMELHKFKYLGREISADSAKIKGNFLVYDGQEIALTPENKDEIQSVLEKIESAYKEDLEKTKEDLSTQKRLVKQKQTLLDKNDKDLAKWEKRAEGRGLSPEEDAFEQQVENLRIAFDGYISRVQPDQIEELQAAEGKTITPRMRAMYLTTLSYMRMQIVAAHDTAVEQYGADLEDGKGGWVQPQ